MVLFADQHHIIGINDHTLVTEGNGRQWYTEAPALFYFDQQQWFNIVYIMQEKAPYFYCNISSPYTFSNGTLHYIDYDIDLIMQMDYSYDIVDREEYEKHRKLYDYSFTIQEKIHHGIATLERWIRERKHPFNKEFIPYWLEKYKEMNR